MTTNYTYKATQFLNVDLDLYSKSDLQPLVTALGQKISVLYVGREGRLHSAHLELAGLPKTADTAIRGLATLIRALPRAERKLWDTAKVRDFNIGVQSALKPHCYEVPLAVETLETVSSLKARIVVTIYAAEIPNRSEGRSTKGRQKSSNKLLQRTPGTTQRR